jgi:hypothetical protein
MQDRSFRRLTSIFAAACVAIWGALALPADAGTIDLRYFASNYDIFGAAADDFAGQSVLFGDVNGDGRGDLIVGARGVDYAGRSSCGALYVILSVDTLTTPIELALQRDDVRVILGPEANAQVGSRVAAGNFNGDPYDDIVVGVPSASPNGVFAAGEVYVIFGGVVPPDTVDLASPASGAVRIQGEAVFDKLGESVSAADVNDDTFDDIIAGAPFATTLGRSLAGRVYVLYGDSSLSGTIDLASYPWAGILLCGSEANDTFGTSCLGADVTNDGVADILAGAPEAKIFGRAAAGLAYVIPGAPALPDTIDMSRVDGPSIKRIGGAAAGSLTGSAFGAGDIDGDSLADIIVASPQLSPDGRTSAGSLYALSGASALPDTVDLASPPAQTTRIDGPAANTKIGRIFACGDLNGDGADDVAIGMPAASPFILGEFWPRTNAGTVHAVFGRAVFPAVVDLAVEQTGITTILGASTAEFTGTSLAIGRFDEDSYDDLLVGATGTAYDAMFSVGKVAVLLGNPDITPTFVLFCDAAASPGAVRIEWGLRDDIDPGLIRVLRAPAGAGGAVPLPPDGLSRTAVGRYVYVDREVRAGGAYDYTAVTLEAEPQSLFTVTVEVPRLGEAVLRHAAPNPFSHGTALSFDIPETGRVALRIYDVRGALVASVADRAYPAGTSTVQWNGRDSSGAPAPSGVYFARMVYEGRSFDRKLIVLR